MSTQCVLSPGEEFALYLYGFSQAAEMHGDMEMPGMDPEAGGAVYLHRRGELAAIVSIVRAGLFTGIGAEARLRDPAWVTAYGCRHASVLEQAGRRTAVFPVPFGILFSSPERLENEMQRQSGHIKRTLAAVAQCDEWALKGILDRAGARRALVAEKLAAQMGAKADTAHSPGRRHLQEQRVRREAEREVNHWLGQKCRCLSTELSELADAFRERRLLPREENGGEMILNWAYLVPRKNAAAFCEKVQRSKEVLEHSGLTLECTGAWPPYSFCDMAP